MDAKLTLKLNQEIIQKAKKYASEKQISLSRLVEVYLSSLTSEKSPNDADSQITPFVKSISTGNTIPLDIDYKNEYSDFLTEKYK